MAVINVELPLLILAAALVLAVVAWFLGTFTHFLRGYRYRVSLGVSAFALSGLMGFFCALKLEMGLFGDWFSAHSILILVTIAYVGYVLFGFLGCWTALRIGERLDRKHTLSMLYSILENKKRDAGRRP
ncbi:MAG TPA: hypothetical protein VGM27_19340 [Acidobacteriaceae bacterium]|jgi:hypothetical protein